MKSLLLIPLLILLAGCPSGVSTTPSTPEQHVVQYLSVICGSDTTQGVNLDLTKAVLTMDQMTLLDKDTTRTILGYTQQVAGFCTDSSTILGTSNPWSTKAALLALSLTKIGPSQWLTNLIHSANQGALVQAAVVAAQTETSGLAAILKAVQ